MKKKRKKSVIGYAHANWHLTKGLAIYHSMLWKDKGPKENGNYAKRTRIKLTMEEV